MRVQIEEVTETEVSNPRTMALSKSLSTLGIVTGGLVLGAEGIVHVQDNTETIATEKILGTQNTVAGQDKVTLTTESEVKSLTSSESISDSISSSESLSTSISASVSVSTSTSTSTSGSLSVLIKENRSLALSVSSGVSTSTSISVSNVNLVNENNIASLSEEKSETSSAYSNESIASEVSKSAASISESLTVYKIENSSSVKKEAVSNLSSAQVVMSEAISSSTLNAAAATMQVNNAKSRTDKSVEKPALGVSGFRNLGDSILKEVDLIDKKVVSNSDLDVKEDTDKINLTAELIKNNNTKSNTIDSKLIDKIRSAFYYYKVIYVDEVIGEKVSTEQTSIIKSQTNLSSSEKATESFVITPGQIAGYSKSLDESSQKQVLLVEGEGQKITFRVKQSEENKII